MGLYFLTIILPLLQLISTVKYRFQPPNAPLLPGQPVFNEKPQEIRRRFRNEGDMESYKMDFCLKYDYQSRVCTKCFDGFTFQQKTKSCLIDPNFKPPKKTEKQLDYIRQQSPALQQKQTNNIMLNRNPFCKNHTNNGALCLACHPGYRLDDGNCIENQDDFTLAEQLYLRPMQAPKNTFCRFFNEEGVCLSCFPQADFDGSECVIRAQHKLDCRLHQLCLPESTQCLTYSSQGFCKSCPMQAMNINGVCRINKPQSLCAQLDSGGAKCAKCTKYGFLQNGKCQFKSPHCLQYNNDNTCNVCTSMYRRMNGQCIRPSKVMFINADPNCATWKTGRCIQCKFGFGFYKEYCISLQQIKNSGNTPDPDPIQVQHIA